MKKKGFLPEGNLGQQSFGGLKWAGVDKGTNIVIQLIIGIILAHLLPPEDFGLIGLAMIIIGFSEIVVDLGFGQALIQKKEITERHVRVCFSISALIGFLIAIIVFFTAGQISELLGSEKVLPIIKALSLLFIFKGLATSSFSILIKRLDFKSLFYVNTISLICYGTSTIFLALTGWGLWSLVIGSLLRGMVGFIVNFIFAPHNIVPLFGKKELNDLAHYGTGMTLNRIFNYFALKGDYFFIGKILGAYSLGIYTRAYNLMQMPTTQFVAILSNILFPAASAIQDDIEKTKNVFFKAVRIISFVTTPICFMIVVLAPEIIIGIYGEKWTDAILPLQILSCVGFLRATYNVGGAFLRAKGLVYKLFRGNLLYGASMCIGVWLGAKYFGLTMASFAVSFSICLIWGSVMYYNAQSLNINFIEIVKAHIPGILIGIISMGGLFLFNEILSIFVTSYIVKLLICVPMAILLTLAAIYILPNKLLFGVKEEIEDVLKQIKFNKTIKRVILKILN